MAKKDYTGEECWVRQDGNNWEMYEIVAIYPGCVIYTDGESFYQSSFPKTRLKQPKDR